VVLHCIGNLTSIRTFLYELFGFVAKTNEVWCICSLPQIQPSPYPKSGISTYRHIDWGIPGTLQSLSHVSYGQIHLTCRRRSPPPPADRDHYHNRPTSRPPPDCLSLAAGQSGDLFLPRLDKSPDNFPDLSCSLGRPLPTSLTCPIRQVNAPPQRLLHATANPAGTHL
jgi:hypothetical protein